MLANGPVRLKIKDTTNTLVSTVSVGAGAVGYSDAFDLADCSSFGIEYIVTCTGTPGVKLEYQQRSDTDIDWYTPDNFAAIKASLTDKNQHGGILSPITVKYFRVKITELTTTVADTVVTIRISGQKRFSV